ncbi:MAG: dihydroorotate dehydrogenase electron transfer subunit [Candidatus Margulisbacteria bacterium]|nr:dihydroorotate dehydrogenase electron transfer subunit [Candidatus Margulisiibacteriota bacterium]
MIQEKARIVEHQQIAPNYYKLTLLSHYISSNTLPGQFIEIRVCDFTVCPLLRRPFSIHGTNKDKKTIEILYEVVGLGTEVLTKHQIGQELDILGPLGNGFTIKKKGKIAILVSGGMGVAPLKALAEHIKAPARYVFMGCKKMDQVVCEKDFSKLGFEVQVATENGSAGKKGLVTDILNGFIDSAQPSELNEINIYACGPKAMLKAVSEIAQQKKLNCQISMEAYMACGIGACKGCAVKTTKGMKMVCKDGPVFPAQEIIWPI